MSQGAGLWWVGGAVRSASVSEMSKFGKFGFVVAACLAAGVLAACGGGGGSSGNAGPGDGGVNPNLLLTLPEPGLKPAQLAVLVAEGDALSEAVGAAYVQARGVPAANLIRVPGLNAAQHDISAADFANVRASVLARLPAGVQATLITWAAPSRVLGVCRMGITSAMAFGFDPGYCAANSPSDSTRLSPYFDSESLTPQANHGMRPSMMLGATSLAQAQALIDRGKLADGSAPAGTGYLVRTSDPFRNARATTDFHRLPALWTGTLALEYLDRPANDLLVGKADVLFYFTGLASVGSLNTLGFRPGAVADHFTSFGGRLPDGNGQMPITRWLEAGATASFGTVEEPFGFTEKFPEVGVLLNHYLRGNTLIEAYWKSVKMPGQGLFIGEPLARPFPKQQALSIESNQYRLRSGALRADTRYALEYRSSAGTWVELGNVRGVRGQAVDVRFPLAPASAQALRWRGPCPGDVSAACTLAESP